MILVMKNSSYESLPLVSSWYSMRIPTIAINRSTQRGSNTESSVLGVLILELAHRGSLMYDARAVNRGEEL